MDLRRKRRAIAFSIGWFIVSFFLVGLILIPLNMVITTLESWAITNPAGTYDPGIYGLMTNVWIWLALDCLLSLVIGLWMEAQKSRLVVA